MTMSKKSILYILAVMIGYALPFGSMAYGAAVWVTSVFLLLFFDSIKLWKAVIISTLALTISSIISFWEKIPGDFVTLALTCLAGSLLTSVIFGCTKVVLRKTRNCSGVFFFPSLLTLMEYINAFSSPFGSFSSMAYSQYGFYPIRQIASALGLLGIVYCNGIVSMMIFLVLKNGIRPVKMPIIISLSTAIVIISLGLSSAARTKPDIQVLASALTPDRNLWKTVASALFADTNAIASKRTWSDSAVAHQRHSLLADLLSKTRQELSKRSEIVLWAEGSAFVAGEEEKSFIQTIRDLSTEYSAMICVSYICSIDQNRQTGNKLFCNKVTHVGPDGAILSEYVKSTLFPGNEQRLFIKGDKPFPVVETRWGKIATAICFDADFPAPVRTASVNGADLLLIPGSDWEAITPYHNRMAAFRAIENGITVFRAAKEGMSGCFDWNGSAIAEKSDFDDTKGITLQVKLPIRHNHHTLYMTLGEMVAGVSTIIVVFCFIMVGIQWRKHPRKTPAIN